MLPSNRKWYYSYRKLFSYCDDAKLLLLSNQILQQYSKSTKAWNPDINSEWACRIYLSSKMILNATVLLNCLEFSREKGMRAANPYFEYYATLSLLRGIVFTLPDQKWDDGNLMSISHSKAINLAFDWLAKFDKKLSDDLKVTTYQLKAQREVISYKAPASGDSILGENYSLVDLLIVLAETAQFNSELLEQSVTKNSPPESFEVHLRTIEQISSFNLEGFSFNDPEDAHRLGYIRRKMPRPYNIQSFMTEGQVEDFIGAWDGDQDNHDEFNNGSPSNWQSIFDIP